ncbi:MAG TPA: prolyl oligopeptidase family serine peptidase [Povalibacter sp.]|nr:prolyl oligopeptidase family serine peptidase [Povalibacter sp.]
MNLRSLCQGWMLLTTLALTTAMADSPTPSATVEPPLRGLWQRGNERFERQWLIAGPMSEQTASRLDVSKLQPAPGAALDPSDPAGARWIPQTFWGDITDLSSSSDVRSARTAFAATQLQQAQAGPAELAIGADGALTVWLNGQKIHERSGEQPFVADSDRIAVTLKQGANPLLIRFTQQKPQAWRFAMRVVAADTALARVEELTPRLEEFGTSLAVHTDLAADTHGSKVLVEAIAAGGTVVAAQTVSRGATARFNAADWHDGAYELRLRTQDALGQPSVTYVPWYKGDAVAAARDLLNAAERADQQPQGATVRMLAALVQDRLGKQLEKADALGWAPIHPALLEYEELRIEAAGRNGTVRAGGFKRLAYVDPVDGSVQFCRAYLPLDYSAKQSWPLILALHGFNPGNPEYPGWWSVDQRHTSIADKKPVIYIEPHGRGNAQYAGIGEQDVLRCLDEAKRTFRVDEDRVYITGESMGGHGTWWIATRHPQLFAAVAPVYGGWDFRVTSVAGPPSAPLPTNARDAYFMERISSFVSAENLLNLPLYVVHGDSDTSVSVENSRHIVKMLQQWGYDVRYHEMPGWGHEDLKQREIIADWLLTHRRNPAPEHVRVRAADLGGADAYWVKVEGFEEPMQIVRVDAQILEPGVVRMDSTNVANVALTLPERLRGSGQSIKVIWNGESQDVQLKDGVARLSSASKAAGLRKRPGFDGPLPSVMSTPFVIVVGTTSRDPRMKQYIADRAGEIRMMWQNWQHQPLRLMKDTEVTSQQEREYSLVLIGGVEENSVTRRLASKLPFKVTRDAVTVDGRTWQTKDSVLQMLYPSPLAAERYVFVAAPTSADGMYLWKPAVIYAPVGVALTAWDWTIQDGRRPPEGELAAGTDSAVAAGLFDANWRRDDRWTVQGDAQRRAAWVLRRAPSLDYRLADEVLQSYAGRYEIFPGFAATVAVEGDHLVGSVPGQQPFMMRAETDTVFRTAVSGDVLQFQRDAQGRVVNVTYENNGRAMVAKRLD